MKIITTSCLSGLLLAAFITTAHAAEPPTGCAAKRQEVETQIEHARAHGNKAQEKKLNIALKQIIDHCTDEGLRKEREADIKKKEEQVTARKAELEKAQATGKTKKIAKQQKKLQEAEAELQEAKNKLAQ